MSTLNTLLSSSGSSNADWDPFSAKRAQGRLELQTGNFARAREILAEVVEHSPDDSDSLVNLGWAYLGSAMNADPGSEQRLLLIEEAEAAARSALEVDWDKKGPLSILAIIEHQQEDPGPNPALEALREYDPTNSIFLALDRIKEEDQALSYWDAGQYEDSVRHCRAALDRGIESWLLRTLIAQDLFFSATEEAYRESLEHSNEAVVLWDRVNREEASNDTPGSFSISWQGWNRGDFVHAMLIFRFHVAALLTETGTAIEARNKLEEYLALAPFDNESNFLNYSEALVSSPLMELRDQARSEEMLDRYLEFSGVEEGAWPEHYAATIEAIRSAWK